MIKLTRTALALVLLSCSHPKVATPTPTPTPTPVASAPPVRVNPLSVPSPLPFLLPPFDQIKESDYRPEYDAGMAEHLREIDAIVKDPAAPTFENTVVAMERSGQRLNRVSLAFGNLNASKTTDELQKIEEEESPKLAAHADAIMLNSALFAKVDAVYKQKDALKLDPESAQLLERYHADFLRAGAGLSDADKTALKQVNEDLSTAQTLYGQNVRTAMKDGGVVVDNVADLDGFSPDQISAAAEAAKDKGVPGKWVITLQNTTTQPALGQLTNRALREKVFRASSDRATSGPADNSALLLKILALRAKKASLLGYPSWAAYALADETAGTPANVTKILADLAPPAMAQAKKEAAAIQKVIDAEAKAAHTKTFPVQPWDWALYAEKVRKAKYSFDESEVKPYFEMKRVLNDGVFWSANQLYGVTFKERKDLPVYDPDVMVYEVDDGDGSSIGLLLLDYFQRDDKQGGAWMNNYVVQSTLLGQKPVIVNNLNVPKPAAGQPVLLSFDDVTTMFHEFGHGLNGLFANTKYPRLSGTATPPDFVEYPSQFNEMWAREPIVLANYAKHYQTGEPMPKALFDKVLAAQSFNSGYDTLEYLEAAAIDLAWHEVPADKLPPPTGILPFENAALKAVGMQFDTVPPRYHSPYFNHIFSGGGYEAGYYAYVWSEVLARDSGAWFHAHGGLTRANGDRYRSLVLSRGRTAEPSVLFQNFYGAPPDVKPLVEYHGLGKK
jgi:peptidyl-dipeptidase Dcp